MEILCQTKKVSDHEVLAMKNPRYKVVMAVADEFYERMVEFIGHHIWPARTQFTS